MKEEKELMPSVKAIEEMKSKITKALPYLSPREQKILSMRFGLEDGITHTLEEVGMEFGVTRERIRQIEARVLDKINSE